MRLPEVSVRRPVTVLMATLAVGVFGFISARQLPVDLLPDLSYPTLTIQTVYPDAAPTSVEQFVTRPVEEAVGVIPGVRDMRSTSRAGLSEVTLEFGWDEAMDFAAMEVRERLGLVQLPREVDPPRVLRFDPSLDPVVRLGLSGERPLDELRRLAERWIKPRLEAIRGVAAAKVRGGLEPEIEVEANLDQLAALGLTLDDLDRALRSENVNVPGGTLKDFGAVYLVRTLHEFDEPDLIRRTVVREGPQGRVRVEDVASVARGHRDREVITRSRGREIVELALHREGSANTMAVAAAVREELAALEGEMPPDLSLEALSDQSVYVSDAIGQVLLAALFGGAIAILVLYFFLRELWATLIVALTIPVSVLATFLFVSRTGVTLNIMSLGGLALGVGMLVDNSIVVLEAIDRRRRQGSPRAEAAALGAGEVAGAVTAATLTTICVFLPIVFVRGVAGQLFYDLAVTVCLSLAASLLVSLTLIPSLAAWGERRADAVARATLFRWDRGAETGEPLPWTLRLGPVELLPVGNGRHPLSRALTIVLLPPRLLLAGLLAVVGGLARVGLRAFDVVSWPAARAVEGVGRGYPRLLSWSLRRRLVVLPGALVLFALSLAAVPSLGTRLVPDLAQGEFAFRLRAPEGTPLEATAQIVERIESLAGDHVPLARIFSVVGTLPSAASGRRERGENLAQIDFVLPDSAGAEDEAAAVAGLRRILALFPTVDAELVHPSVLTLKPPVAVRVFSDDLSVLDEVAGRVAAALSRLASLRDVASTAEPGSPEIRIEPDRERAGALGIRAEDLSRSLRRQIQGEVVGKFREEEDRIDIRLRAAEAFRSRASEVESLRIRLADGTSVPVASLARVVVERGPAAIHRVSGGRVSEVTARASITDLGASLEQVRRAIARLEVPPGAVVELAGQDEELKVSFDSLKLALALAVFLVYVVMAVQFESLVHPFVILLSVPLGIVGVVLALHVVGLSISVLVLIGSVMLSGIVVNNSIVLVDAVNRRRREGDPLEAAIAGAGRERLRPILMTTATTVLALLPMAIGLGAGDELRAPLAVTVIGGLLGATVLTLVVIPCLYRTLAGGASGLQPTGRGEPSPAAPVVGEAEGV